MQPFGRSGVPFGQSIGCDGGVFLRRDHCCPVDAIVAISSFSGLMQRKDYAGKQTSSMSKMGMFRAKCGMRRRHRPQYTIGISSTSGDLVGMSRRILYAGGLLDRYGLVWLSVLRPEACRRGPEGHARFYRSDTKLEAPAPCVAWNI